MLSLITLLVTKVTSHLCTSEGSLQTGLRVGHTQPVPPRQLPGKGERWGSQEALPLGAGSSSVGPREQVPQSLSCLLPRPSFVYICRHVGGWHGAGTVNAWEYEASEGSDRGGGGGIGLGSAPPARRWSYCPVFVRGGRFSRLQGPPLPNKECMFHIICYVPVI